MTQQSFYRDHSDGMIVVHVDYSGPRRRTQVSDRAGEYTPLQPSGYSRSHLRKLEKQRAAHNTDAP